MGEVIRLAGRGEPTRRITPPPPPAPNPADGYATTWGELFDNLWYLLDAGQHHTLRQRLKDYANLTDGVPLPPDVFDVDAD